jgi:hypothetical protein
MFELSTLKYVGLSELYIAMGWNDTEKEYELDSNLCESAVSWGCNEATMTNGEVIKACAFNMEEITEDEFNTLCEKCNWLDENDILICMEE